MITVTLHNEDLHRQNDQNVVDVETGLSIIERQEPVNRKLRTQITVLLTEHLFTHTHPDLCLEVQNCAKAKITAFTALIVLRVLDATAASEHVHTREDIFVQVQTLLHLTLRVFMEILLRRSG